MRKNILILGHNHATQFIDIFNQYTRLFDKDKYEVTVAYLTGKPSDEVRERTIAENVLFLDIPKKTVRSLKIGAIRQLHQLCRQKQFQIVICHRYKPSYTMMWVAQFCKIPALIFVMHELKTMSHLNRQLLIAALARKNMMLAGVSNAVRDDIKKDLWSFPKERITTLYNAIDFDLVEPALLSRDEARKALNLGKDDFVFGHLGRLAINKDQTSLIQAFSKIKANLPQAKLVIVGDGELEAKLKEQTKALNLTQDVIFTGFIQSAFRYMKAFDCFVLSSIQEAFGRVLLEAMVAKLPLIATKANGIPEVIGDSGVLIEPRDVDGLSSAMQEIYSLSESERKLKGEKAYQHALANFSIPQFTTQFWQLPVFATIKD